MKKKINGKKIIVIILIILFIYPTSIFGRYVYNATVDSYFTSKNFYFESNLLTMNNDEVPCGKWRGNGTYSIDVYLYSMKNSVQKVDYDMSYTFSCSMEDEENSKLECAVNSSFTSTEKNNGVIYGKVPTEDGEPVNTNTAMEAIYLRAKEGETLKAGDTYTVNVTAVGTGEGENGAKYTKRLYGKLKVIIANTVSQYSITDSNGSNYLVLTLTNPKKSDSDVILNWNADKLRIDSTNKYYLKSRNNENFVNNIGTTVVNLLASNNTVTQSTATYVNSLKMVLEDSTTTKIKFYKTDISDDYTWSEENSEEECAIQVSFPEV